MKTLNIRYKDGFKIEEDTKLYPINSDINDKMGVLVEHRRLNGDNRYLRYGIQKLSGKYYFFDVRNSVISKTRESEYNTYICPYCKERMFIVSEFERKGTMIPIHLKHYKKSDKECIFRSDTRSMKLRDGYYKSEEFLRKEIQTFVCKSAQKGFNLNIASSYKLYKNIKKKSIRADVLKESVKIVKAIPKDCKEKKSNKNYIPDIILYTKDNKEIYCEIVISKSLNSADYYEKWQSLGKTVIEIRKTAIRANHLDEYKFSKNLMVSYLYDPILDEARKGKISESQNIIENSQSITSETENLDNNKNNPEAEIRKKEKRKFYSNLNQDIKKYLNKLCEENILRKEENGYFDVKENKKVKVRKVVILKHNKRVYKNIPVIIEKYLRNDGYKVGIDGKSRK